LNTPHRRHATRLPVAVRIPATLRAWTLAGLLGLAAGGAAAADAPPAEPPAAAESTAAPEAADEQAAAPAEAEAPVADAEAPASDLSTGETIAFLGLLALFPLSVLGVRWLTQRHIQRMMNRDSAESAEAGPSVSDGHGVRVTVPPRFEMHDKTQGLDDAVQVRETFVARSLGMLRRFVMLDVVAGAVYVALLATLGAVSPDEDQAELVLGFVIIGSVYPLLAGLRYLLYRRQFRPLDARFRRRGLLGAPMRGLVGGLRQVLSPRFQAVSAGLWVAFMALLGLGLAFDDAEPAPVRAVAGVLAAVALLQPVLVWRILRRLQREPGVCLLVLRVFGIDANASFTFGRLLAFWQHFGNHFTVLDPSIWRLRYPLMSWRTGVFMLGVAMVGLLALGIFVQYPQWEPVAFTATAPVLLGMLGLYALLSRLLLGREFIRNRAQLVQVLDRLAQRPRHLDLSFRQLEVMCHNNTWKIAVQEFARRSQVLLMDLRGFSSARKGCEYEVDFLLDAVPLPRVLFLVEAGGDHEAVRRLILDRWSFLSPSSPNLHDPDPVARIYVSSASDEADVQGILDLLMFATQQGQPPAVAAAARPPLARAA
jgi:hypothetical protein